MSHKRAAFQIIVQRTFCNAEPGVYVTPPDVAVAYAVFGVSVIYLVNRSYSRGIGIAFGNGFQHRLNSIIYLVLLPLYALFGTYNRAYALATDG